MPDNAFEGNFHMRSPSLYHPVTIGSVTVEGNIFLAPLAGYTDRAFRTMCKWYGASFTYSEMVSAEGIARGGKNSDELMVRSENEEQFSIQLFMRDAEVVARALPRVLLFNPTVIDVNCGCPVPKVVKTGAGSSLLVEPKKIFNIVKTIVDGCDVPVSVKIRLGWDMQSINYEETAGAALSAGASMITMHARTKSMGYAGKADWQALADLKRFVSSSYPSVPLFGSGDLFSAEAAKEMLETTRIDGVMFARGAIGNPFIFQDTITLLETNTTSSFHDIEERIAAMRTQLELHSAIVGERLACRQMRKHAAAYLKGMSHSTKAKQELVQASSIADYEEVFKWLSEEHR